MADGRGLKIEVVADEAKLAELRATLDPKDFPKALSGAVNKTLAKTRTQVVRTVREILNLKTGDINDRLTVKKGSPSNPSGYVRVSRKGVPMVAYGARQTARGVTVSVRKGQGRTLLKPKDGEGVGGTFLATMKSGHRGVFSRRPDWKHKLVDTVKGHRIYHGLRIYELFGPTVVGVITGKPGTIDKLNDFAAADLTKQLDSQVQRFMAKQPVDAE